MRLLITICCLAICTASFAQNSALIQGNWKLETMSRNNGNIMFYNRVTDQADGYPPVYWKFTLDTMPASPSVDSVMASMHIKGDLSVKATDPVANDVVESHYYTISGDTLILTRFFNKDLELATMTNSPKATYRINMLTASTLELLLYDRMYDGTFRKMDVYSRRYIFSKE
jgi:hypothetical protein